MTERQTDSLLRADLWKCVEHFKGYGKDALLITLPAYNVGVWRLLGYSKHPKSRLLRKIEAGDRNIYREYVSFCRYKGKVLRGLVKRRQVEFALLRHLNANIFFFLFFLVPLQRYHRIDYKQLKFITLKKWIASCTQCTYD